jgi:hypothetical protein
MDVNLIYIWILLFWIWSLEAIYMESKKHRDYLKYTNFKSLKVVEINQLKYLYINLYLYLCLSV